MGLNLKKFLGELIKAKVKEALEEHKEEAIAKVSKEAGKATRVVIDRVITKAK